MKHNDWKIYLKGPILDMSDVLKVNYYAADKGKSLTFRVFIEAKMSLLCMYTKFQIIFFK